MLLLLSWLHDWGEMNVDRYPFQFVTHHNNESYYCFLWDNDTIKDLVSQFLEMIAGRTYKPNHDYGAQILFFNEGWECGIV